MTKKSIFLYLISFFILFSILTIKTNQQQSITTEIPDSKLDPEDVLDYENEKQLEITTIAPSIERTLTVTELDPTTTTTVTEPEIEPDSTTAELETTEAFSEEITTTEAESQQTLTLKPKQKSNDLNEFEYELTSTFYKEILVEKSDDKTDIAYYIIKASKPQYQVELFIDSNNVFPHLDFSQCPIQRNDTSQECLGYIEILESNFVLRIKRHLLPKNIILKLRPVISGCDSFSRIRDIDLESNMPAIYHNSDHDCIYRVKNNDLIRSMMSIEIQNFPMDQERQCHASAHVSNTNNLINDEPTTQAIIESSESIEMLRKGVFVASKYALIKLINCFENTESIELKINKIKTSYKKSILGEKSKQFNQILNSKLITSTKQDTTLLYEIINEDPRNRIDLRLTDYVSKTVKEECDKLEKNTSSIIIYGQDQFNQMFFKQYTPCKFDTQMNELRGFKRVYVQFMREKYHQTLAPSPDNFNMEFDLKRVEKFYKLLTNETGYFSSETAELSRFDLRNFHLDFEIKAPIGHRIILDITKFSNGKEMEEKDKHLCNDFAIIKLNRTTNRIDSLIEKNPVLCNFAEKPKNIFSSFSNTLLLTFSFDAIRQNDQVISIPKFAFTYRTEPICNNIYTKLNKPTISFSSLESIVSNDFHEQINCLNSIKLKNKRRIVLYKIDWLRNVNSLLLDKEEEINNNFINGQSICNSSDSLLISNENPKYLSNDQTSVGQYCMENPFFSFISESSNVHLNFKRSTDPTHLVKPLVFDIGYFSYKYLYTETDKMLNIDFSKLIPDNIGNRTKIDSLQFKIKLANQNNYIYPIISDCYTDVKHGDVNIRANQRSVPFKMSCENQTFTLMSSMENELSIEFSNIMLSELRDNSIRFKLHYTSQPRVFTDLKGQFETNNFQHSYINPTRESVEYEFVIDLEPSFMIELSIDELRNDMGINEITINDANTNENLYEQNELIENYKLGKKFTYLFSSNKIRITFKHMKENNAKLSKYPFLRCSYTGRQKVINYAHQTGDIGLENSLTKNIIEWLIIAPPDHSIIVKITKFNATEDRGQLKFSLLGNGYSDNGIYHFNLNNIKPTTQLGLYERNTDIIVSKDNMIRVEYSSGGLNDLFKFKYTFVPKVRNLPCGMIKSQFNDLIEPVIYVPKLTDQHWVIRAPYSKRIQLFTKYIDLLNENPCSKASVSFLESNGSLIDSKCGHLDFRQPNVELETMYALNTSSNELDVRFKTQNTNDVVYSNVPPQFQPYKGFLYYYAFLEDSGDCYFQFRKNSNCNYKNTGGVNWLVRDETVKGKGQDESDFEKYFCMGCFLRASLPIQSENEKISNAVFVSPVINKSNKHLKFMYNLKNSAKLSIKFVYEKEYTINPVDRSLVLKVLNDTSNEWRVGRVKIGSNDMFYDFRIMFVLERSDEGPSPLQPEASIDNIQLYEQDFDCGVTTDLTCPSDDSDLKDNNSDSLSHCQTYLTPCDSIKCQNGAVCLNKDNPLMESESYTCLCAYGYTGKFCETQINACELPGFSKCLSNSKCVPSESSLMEYECQCDKNYFGLYCENKYEPCKQAENPCNQQNGQGTCIDQGSAEDPNKYTCTCSPMYSGANCEFIIREKCLNSECNKHDPKAVCIELEDRFVCKCSPGFEGPSCMNIDDCIGSPCQNNGTCIDEIMSFKCQCDEQFNGKYCEESKLCSQCNPEATLLCEEGKCVCKETFDGDRCEIELDPCATQPCSYGDCISNRVDGDFECLCHYGYKGKNCDKKEDLCDQGFCKNGATCILELEHETDNIGYVCKCQSGFDGKNCEILIDQCETNPCKNGATCLTSVNNYTCACQAGYAGRNCEQLIDNCVNSKCADGSTCVSVLNSYICKCPIGYFGRYCNEELDKCLNNECQNGKCIPSQLDNQYRCNCVQGYTGRFCEINIDDCESNPCQNSAMCVDLLNSYKCICPQNYTGRNCESTFNYCSLPETSCSPTNTKRCISIPGGNKCECLPRFTGLKCETQIDVCDFHKPCRSGSCKSLGANDYVCENCDNGFIGKNCSEIIDHCAQKKPCENGATCLFEAKGYFCKCPEGYTGKNCKDKLNLSCLYHKCQHNSECIPTQNGYRCECDGKHEGQYCELKKKDMCKDKQCDGYCVDGRCECDPRIIFCNKKSECHNIKCEHGGTCVDVIKGEVTVGMCLCPPGLTGKNCEQSMFCNSTRALPCGSNNQCATVNQTYECQCDRPFIGHGCNKRISDYLPDYEIFLKQEKLMNDKSNCRFGNSKESKIFIGIIALGTVIFLIVGFLIGHFSIISYRKRYESASKMNIKSNYSIMSDSTSRSMNFVPRTPLMKSRAAHDITLNKSAGGFSIPRPSVRL